MKALTLIAAFFAVFLIFLGSISKKTSGEVLGNTVIIGGLLIGLTVVIIWILNFLKEKKKSE